MGGDQRLPGHVGAHAAIAQDEMGEHCKHRFAGGALHPPDGETTQPETGVMRMARQAPALAAAGLVEELKAEREEKREYDLDKHLGITKELKVRRRILKIDGDGTVLTCRLGGWSHLSPPLRWSLTLMRHHGGNVLKYQECCEIRRVLPLNPMECEETNPPTGGHDFTRSGGQPGRFRTAPAALRAVARETAKIAITYFYHYEIV